MANSLNVRQVVLISVVGALLSFQNCAQAPENGSTDNSSNTSDNGMPFAYDAAIDTLSYMSCSGINNAPVERRAYYTIRVGAYSSLTGGLTLNTAFRNATRFYGITQRAQALAASEQNRGALLNVSIRSNDNYQVIWKEGADIRAEEELDALLPPLASGEIGGPLAATAAGQRLNYFPGDFTQRLMEGSLRMYNFYNSTKDTRDSLHAGSSLVVVGYSDSLIESETPLRGPGGTPATSIYGTGYNLSFSAPAGYTTGERRVLASADGVREKDLLTNMPKVANWDCSTAYQYTIIRPEDIKSGVAQCATTVDRYADSTQQASLAAIRRVLRVEDWFVDPSRRCIVPKRTGDYCYGPLNGKVIQYGVTSCFYGPSTQCPHFVSVCIKR